MTSSSSEDSDCDPITESSTEAVAQTFLELLRAYGQNPDDFVIAKQLHQCVGRLVRDGVEIRADVRKTLALGGEDVTALSDDEHGLSGRARGHRRGFEDVARGRKGKAGVDDLHDV